MTKAPIWYLPGPFYRYAEDVKALARKAGVRIVDANVTEDRRGAADPKALPKATLKPEYRQLTKAERAAVEQAKALTAPAGE